MKHLILASALAGSFAASAGAQGLITAPQQSVLAGPLPTAIDALQIAIDGDRMALQGSTFVRVGGEWLPFEPLIGTTRAVAADGGHFVTGNRLRNYDGASYQSGVARVQSATPAGWVIDATLVPGDLRPRLEFGAELAVSGDTIAVLASGWRPVGQSYQDAVGAVYIFRETASGWVEDALLTPASGGLFAFPNGRASIALDGDMLVVTGRVPNPGGGSLPAINVLQRSAGSWSLATQLVLPNGSGDGGLGLDVDVQEDVPGASASIAAHSLALGGRIFTGYGASWQSQDIADDTWSGPIRFSGSVLAVADPTDVVTGASVVGSVHLYERDNAGMWQFQSLITAQDPSAVPYFAANLDLDGESLAVASGGFLGNVAPLDPLVEVFRVLPVGATEYCVGLPNSTGAVARIASSGSTSVAVNELELVAGPVPSGSGLFYYGATQVQVPFGNGFRCVGAAGGAFRLRQSAVSNGLLTQRVDFTAPPSAGGQILPGSTWNFQAWYRDAATGAGFNLSTGLELFFTP